MTVKNLGSMIFLLFCIPLELYAWVQTTAPKEIVKTETLEFRVVAKGFHVTFPMIEYIDGYVVQNVKTFHEATLIHAKKADKVTKIYSLTPTEDVILPAFSIKVDGKVEKTQPLHVKVKKRTQTHSPDYKLSMNISNITPMVGEKFLLHVRLVSKNVEDYTVETPRFNDFALQEISDKEYENNKGEWVEELSYEIIAQKSGPFVLNPIKAAIELSTPKYAKRNIYSNALRLEVKKIPNNLTVMGSYELNASVNVKHVQKNQPVQLTLSLQGEGNINNFDDINISIEGATVYEKRTKKLHRGEEEIYQKSFEIVSDKNFTIPSVSLEYFDIKEQRVKEITTQAFAIHVEDAVLEERTKTKQRTTRMEKAVYFLSGVFVTLFLVYMYQVLKNTTKTDKQKRIKKELQSIGDKEKFLKKIVPYLGKNRSLDRLLYTLENVENSEFKQLKKEIIRYICEEDIL
ncbi:BatD family protein [Sulfurimonas sp. SWIR-19]|uniref:BatD family protein n=1 Tax=Sulfurimonas sp. SWIR-19 TaxID=2878390 RepID=UPI001CF1521D|nr:BatD family protein [Sulfurimonas sp. SWIR-19]UCM99361.1 BatD family protein [Sulfurimonas sp. SWIR-19]